MTLFCAPQALCTFVHQFSLSPSSLLMKDERMCASVSVRGCECDSVCVCVCARPGRLKTFTGRSRSPGCLCMHVSVCLFVDLAISLFIALHLIHTSMCLRRCRAKWSDLEKLRSQSAHLKGFTPVCFL